MQRLSKRELKAKLRGDASDVATYPKLVDDELVTALTNFIAAHPSLSKKLFNHNGEVPHLGRGIGKGEVLVYYVFDDVTLGGTSSSIDVHVSGIPYLEVKCAKRRASHVWADFRLGADEWMASHHLLERIVSIILKLDAKGKLTAPENFGNIPKSMLDRVKELAPKAWKAAEDEYYKRLFDGRCGHKRFLFFDIDTRLPIYYGKLNREQLSIERFSSGQVRLIFDPTACLQEHVPGDIINISDKETS